MLYSRFGASLLALLALTACSYPSVVRKNPPALPLGSDICVELRLPQKEVFVMHPNSTAGGAAGMQAAGSPAVASGGFAAGAAAGLFGALIDAGINLHRQHVAEDLAKPIQAATNKVDFNALIEGSLAGLDKQNFAAELRIERLGTTESEDQDTGHLRSGESILVLAPSYFVSYDEKHFVYALDARVVSRTVGAEGRTKTTERYHQNIQYLMPRSEITAGEHWDSLTPEQWRGMFEAAASEMIAMLNYDIAARPSDTTPLVTYGSPQRLHLEKQIGTRAWLRSPWMLVSVPSAGTTPSS